MDIENPEKSLTYSQLKTQVLKCAAGLKREFNLQYGDGIAVCSPNQIGYSVLLHSAVCAGKPLQKGIP